ncbi:MAG: hypothetical protein FD146_2009 [Anaerolineaceae bacterium]|nr:MAG: hypothetical protein FD146_2009 [Anaerolineaceae bacterium]
MARDEAYQQAEQKIKQALKSGAMELPIHHQFTCSLFIEN